MQQFSDFEIKARTQLSDRLPLAAYCRPGSSMVEAYFQLNDIIHSSNDLLTAGFISRRFFGGPTYCIPNSESNIMHFELPNQVSENAEALRTHSDLEEKNFKILVKSAIDAIQKGSFQKVVLSRSQKMSVPNLDIIRSFGNILQYDNAFRYLLFLPGVGLWMGATPEKLLSLDKRSLTTVALAGTRLIKEDGAKWGAKELDEQRIVSNYIRDELQTIASSVTLSEPHTATAGNLQHIKTDIICELHERVTLREAVDVLHPTPAVCGFPKKAALRFINEQEGYDREFYSGYVGVVGDNATDLYVNLRCMRAHEDSVTAFVGCGITAESDPEKEYMETVHKAETITKVL